MDQDSVDTAIAAAGHKVTYVGTGTTVLGWLASADVVSVMGLVVALIGLIVNVFFKVRDDRRKQRLYSAQMKQIERGEDAILDHE